MTLDTQIAALTQSTSDLVTAVNVHAQCASQVSNMSAEVQHLIELRKATL